MIDPYPANASLEPYAALRKVAAARTQSIEAAADSLQANANWPRERADLFSLAAARRLLVPFEADDALRDAILEWQCDQEWARGAAMGGWSDAFLGELDDANADLRGMGGAGIPATQKWRDVRDAVRSARKRKQDDRAFIVVNADESEPGTFKDRELLLRTPHLIVEAVVIAGLITDATEGFIYIRHEYPEQIEACEREIRRAEEMGVCGATGSIIGRPFKVSVFVSPGGYICGEQSALIEAMSDRRAEPRNMPPKLETNGLDDRPTLVSNVETFAWVPYILLSTGKAYAALGVNGWRGRRFFSVSGDVNRPGVYEVPMGLTLRELINGKEYCQGMKNGRPLKAIAPSGPSGGFLPARLTAKAGLPRDHTNNRAWKELAARRGFDPQAQELDILDLELELNLFRSLSPTQALGAGIVVYAEGRDMAEQAFNAIEFFRNESCGKCVPCRIGSQKLAALGENVLAGRVDADRWKSELQPLASELGRAMELSSICGLGRATPAPLRTVVEFFPDDLSAHLARGEAKR
jgi:NADH:ubiquinone oxidoreductase subunit F (NADH-binding)